MIFSQLVKDRDRLIVVMDYAILWRYNKGDILLPQDIPHASFPHTSRRKNPRFQVHFHCLLQLKAHLSLKTQNFAFFVEIMIFIFKLIRIFEFIKVHSDKKFLVIFVLWTFPNRILIVLTAIHVLGCLFILLTESENVFYKSIQHVCQTKSVQLHNCN